MRHPTPRFSSFATRRHSCKVPAPSTISVAAALVIAMSLSTKVIIDGEA